MKRMKAYALAFLSWFAIGMLGALVLGVTGLHESALGALLQVMIGVVGVYAAVAVVNRVMG
jgi:hypothetical protein